MNQENKLGTVPVPKLLFQFGLPSVISMLVNSIYNIVDQIFIGHKVGYLGNAATSVTFPFVTIGLAVSLMISAGTAANVGLHLGRKEQKEADLTLANGFIAALFSGVLLMVLGELFLTPLLRLFGATDMVLPYALDYAGIYIIGLPFIALGIVLNDEIRADGNPGYAMRGMLYGAVFNIVFDYIFVYPMNMGVKGAALATIMGQFITMVVNLLYLRKMKTIHLYRENLVPKARYIRDILTLGFSSFIAQTALLIQQIVLNRQAARYGAASIYGAEIPLTVFGIIMKINQIMMAFIMGITTGSQPIYSYNYGAGKYDRVRSLVKISLVVTTIIGLCGMFVLQTFPAQIISIFGQEDGLYNEFAVMAMKNMTFFIFILGVQMTASIYFQSIGKPKGATVISLSRQIIFMIPSLFILPYFFGIKGVMWSFPVADVASVTLCSILLAREMRLLNGK